MSDPAIDPFTSLLSRKGFEKRLAAEMKSAALSGRVLSLIFLDIDFFSRVNDLYGHATGDAVILAVRDVIRAHVPAGEHVGRFGGEEYAIVLPGREREEAFLLAEGIRAEVAEKVCSVIPDNAVLTISGGVSAFPSDALDDAEVVRMTDQALYRAKSTGRNKVCIAQAEKMVVKTAHYPVTQLARLSQLAKERDVGEATLLREGLDDLLIKYKVSDIES
jgi:diguanylate cyclase (GGDEF)-like protein